VAEHDALMRKSALALHVIADNGHTGNAHPEHN
jgi:hypothetical protein